ncbi:MAG: imidazoleglycerol-phosphate dehydratase HisB [Smithellaceae bacterium]|nr:imidazoleglycerol-phosphate dehydratase HisB [Smithellaceae bacterium]
MMRREATIERKTKETEVLVNICLDGSGEGSISTEIPFFDHMLNLFARHSLIDLTVKGRGDREIDDHHLVEDVGITLGMAFGQAMGEKKGIERYGHSVLPMDDSLCSVSVDLSGRPYLVYNVDYPECRIGAFSASLVGEFFKAFSDHSGITLHINLRYGKNSHHIAEAVFKATARAIREALTINRRIAGVLSTKGSL